MFTLLVRRNGRPNSPLIMKWSKNVRCPTTVISSSGYHLPGSIMYMYTWTCMLKYTCYHVSSLILRHGKSPKEVDFKGCRQQNMSKLPFILSVQINFPKDVIIIIMQKLWLWKINLGPKQLKSLCLNSLSLCLCSLSLCFFGSISVILFVILEVVFTSVEIECSHDCA